MNELAPKEWLHEGRPPFCDDVNEYQVWVYGDVRRVRRVGNKSVLTPGTLIYTDCTHPLQNVICDEKNVLAWRRT
jgi:hypothetical protein